MQDLNVTAVEDAKVTGIYKVGGSANKMPTRTRRLHPKARESFIEISGSLVISDMFRTPESSLQAVLDGRGALMPSYSAHGYGLSLDIDITKAMKVLGFKKKAQFDEFMASHNWLCHRLDGLREFEEWHYDYDLDGLVSANVLPKHRSRQPAREKMLQTVYGAAWALTAKDAQVGLKELGLYSGAIDGIFGKLSKQALLAFQRAWKLKTDGVLSDQSKRVLWFVAACKRLPDVTV